MVIKYVRMLSSMGPTGASFSSWSKLFEPYHFFESYKNFLQVDISAMNFYDLRLWKGWVESRLRQLTLKIVTSKKYAHYSFLLGLQRKEGIKVKEEKPFDIRGPVDEFMHSVNMYMYHRPGMKISVLHVRIKQLPAFLFPKNEECKNGYGNRLKRKNSPNAEVDGNQRAEKRLAMSSDKEKLSSPESCSGEYNRITRIESVGSEREKNLLPESCSGESGCIARADSCKVCSSPDSVLDVDPDKDSKSMLCTSGDAENGNGASSKETDMEAVPLESEHVLKRKLQSYSLTAELECKSTGSLEAGKWWSIF